MQVGRGVMYFVAAWHQKFNIIIFIAQFKQRIRTARRHKTTHNLYHLPPLTNSKHIKPPHPLHPPTLLLSIRPAHRINQPLTDTDQRHIHQILVKTLSQRLPLPLQNVIAGASPLTLHMLIGAADYINRAGD